MAEVNFYNKVDDSKLSFAVIIARFGSKWVLCKHRNRTTYEFPGGHREAGESIEQTAERELREETGAVKFTLKHICDYSVQGVTREGEKFDKEVFGTLFYAEIGARTDKLHSEIEEVVLLENLPDSWTYPTIMPKLIEEAWAKIMQNERGTAYFLVDIRNQKQSSLGDNAFTTWLLSEGFKRHEVYQCSPISADGVWVNFNNKLFAIGKPGIRCYEEIGHHAITVDEFKTIYAIYKKYEGKAPFMFD